MLDGSYAVHGQPHVLDHLAGIELGGKEAFDTARGQFGQRLLGERIERDRTQQADLQPFGARHLDRGRADTGRRTERHDHVIRIVAANLLITHLVLFERLVFLLQALVDDLSLIHI